MRDEYLELKRNRRTFAPSFTAFILQWLEMEIVRHDNPDLVRYARALERHMGLFVGRPLTRPLTKSKRRRTRRDPLGAMVHPSIPNYVKEAIDKVRKKAWLRGVSRLEFVRMCVRRGLDILGTQPVGLVK